MSSITSAGGLANCTRFDWMGSMIWWCVIFLLCLTCQRKKCADGTVFHTMESWLTEAFVAHPTLHAHWVNIIKNVLTRIHIKTISQILSKAHWFTVYKLEYDNSVDLLRQIHVYRHDISLFLDKSSHRTSPDLDLFPISKQSRSILSKCCTSVPPGFTVYSNDHSRCLFT